MNQEPKKEERHGKKVWVNPTTEALRKDECLCLHCGNLKSDTPEHCPTAKAFFEICVRDNIALAVTRCPNWGAEKKWKLMIGMPGHPYEVRAEKNTWEEIVDEYERTETMARAATFLGTLYIVGPDGSQHILR